MGVDQDASIGVLRQVFGGVEAPHARYAGITTSERSVPEQTAASLTLDGRHRSPHLADFEQARHDQHAVRYDTRALAGLRGVFSHA